MAQMSKALANRVIDAHRELVDLYYDLYQHGHRDVGQAVERAARELQHPSITGPLNHRGVDSAEIRP